MRAAGKKESRKNPGTSRELLLAAARREFARRGFEGARVDEIAKRAGVNKQLVYHHFGNKEALYRLVLESVYTEIREQEKRLDLSNLDPEQALRRLIEFSFDYLAANRDFVALLTDENLHKGRRLKQVANLQPLHSPLIEILGQTLARGTQGGLFRPGLDPMQVYISIAGLGFFYFNNIHTLSAIFGRKFEDKTEIAARRAHVVDLMLHALRP
ncbi:TetR family transcriptional regulator [Oceanibaculum pacificum]|uniref:TetR family transcriptional regulator n=1 Tax=Oceanibaculum pacificum TaxID=580166 RepID=A0A154W675_9PROT|nr:TetR family transcriptional regulator [Oceanibaculum pacificum]